MFWFNKKNPLALYLDKRREHYVSPDGYEVTVDPDVLGDFTALPFADNTFYLVVFDPPHLTSLGENALLGKKYGRLFGDWRCEIQEGFSECWRVLKENGVLIFKWSSTDVPLSEVLTLCPAPPLFGHTTSKMASTHWITFLKHSGAVAPAPEEGDN